MKKIKFGIAGTGKFSEYHARTIKPLNKAKLVGFYSSSKERAKKLSKKFKCKPFTDYESFLNSIDVAVIATKNNQHVPLAEQAIQANKHVLVEKPFAITKQEMESLLELSRKTPVKTASVLEFRYGEVYKKAKQIIDSGKLGKIITINLGIFQNKPSREWKSKKEFGGGLLLMHLIHYLDILTYLIPEKPSKITSYLRGKEAEDSANIIFSYKNFDVTISSSCVTKYDKQDKIEIIGENSSIILLDHRILINDDKLNLSKVKRIARRLMGTLGIATKKVKYYKSPKLRDVYKDFLTSIKNNSEPFTSLENTKDSLNLIFEIKNNNLLK